MDPRQEATDTIEAIDAFTASIPEPEITANAGKATLTDARHTIGDIVRAAGLNHRRTLITNQGEPAALVVHPEDWADLVGSLAIARAALTRINGTAGEGVPSDEAYRQVFGEERESAA